jgi:hypothetical protein
MTFRANVTPILQALGVTVTNGQPAPVAAVQAVSVADELAKLAPFGTPGC